MEFITRNQSYLDGLEWHQLPRDGGQIVSVTYATDEEFLYRHSYDRSDQTHAYFRESINMDADEDFLRFEPWNGNLPDTTGEVVEIRTGDAPHFRKHSFK
jgi:hypothetical protein